MVAFDDVIADDATTGNGISIDGKSGKPFQVKLLIRGRGVLIQSPGFQGASLASSNIIEAATATVSTISDVDLAGNSNVLVDMFSVEPFQNLTTLWLVPSRAFHCCLLRRFV